MLKTRIYTLGPHTVSSNGILNLVWTTDRDKAFASWSQFWATHIKDVDRTRIGPKDYHEVYESLGLPVEQPNHSQARWFGEFEEVWPADLLSFVGFDNDGVAFRDVSEADLIQFVGLSHLIGRR